MLRSVLALVFLMSTASDAASGRDTVLQMARKGWVYELRTTMIGRDMSIPVRINGRDMAGAAICVVGEAPNRQTRAVLDEFRALMRDASGKTLPMRYAGPSARACGTGRTVILRLYSRRPPNAALTDDLHWMNEVLKLGLPTGRSYMAVSPAMAQTFFGRRGSGTHLMVKQAASNAVTRTERAFYRSILIEELFQSFTFGMDILHFDRDAAFLSKLEEYPTNLMDLPWESRMFMEGILNSNPTGLCAFDVFMLHAVASSPVEETNDAAFLDFIDARYEALTDRTRTTLANADFEMLFDPECVIPFD
ncbi:hypothetical protein [Roseivivax sediminis]|uniref:Uncharacterized protein n=1 Tax=Roseivivax sediminis TaxID=936889 RepID=A0A1I1TXD5_9RHOB|nr:hypothetical protein [Roseivivax sediminis]SFD63252.1 hypothetical protein SAMN04515678_10228 [Roseivivax sediminis]